jgi:hypothetical protein
VNYFISFLCPEQTHIIILLMCLQLLDNDFQLRVVCDMGHLIKYLHDGPLISLGPEAFPIN